MASHLHKFVDMARPTEKVFTQRIAPLVRLISQLHLTDLANVTINMKVLFHRHNSHCFFGALDWSYSFTTSCAFRSKNSVKVVNAVDFVVKVDGEGHSIKTFVADAAAKASWVVRLAHSL